VWTAADLHCSVATAASSVPGLALTTPHSLFKHTSTPALLAAGHGKQAPGAGGAGGARGQPGHAFELMDDPPWDNHATPKPKPAPQSQVTFWQLI